MKHLLLLIVLVLLFSCENIEETGCWECTMIKIDPESTSSKIPSGFERVQIDRYCDKTEAEIRKIEELGTFDHNLFEIAWHQTTTCKLL